VAFLLLQNGGFLLLQNGGKLLLQGGGVVPPIPPIPPTPPTPFGSGPPPGYKKHRNHEVLEQQIENRITLDDEEMIEILTVLSRFL